MARLWISRIMLLYSALTALLLALSLPEPSLATAEQIWKLVILLVLAGTCLVTFVLLRRRPRIGWRIAGVLGILGAVILCLYGRSLWLLAQSGSPTFLVGAAIPFSLSGALMIAGACSVGHSRQTRGENEVT